MNKLNEAVATEPHNLAIAEKLNTFMEDRSVTTKDLVNATGISTTLINMLKRGEGNPSVSNLLKIARFFGVPASYFLDADTSKESSNSNVHPIKVFDINKPQFTGRDEQYIITVRNDDFGNADFGVRINDDAFEPVFSKGTVFLINKNGETHSGSTVLIRINKENRIGKVHYHDDKAFLSSLGIDSDITELKQYQMIGTVIGTLKN